MISIEPAGGKQLRSSMGPVIAFRDGQPAFSVGAAGGSTIPTTILQIILNHVDFGALVVNSAP